MIASNLLYPWRENGVKDSGESFPRKSMVLMDAGCYFKFLNLFPWRFWSDPIVPFIHTKANRVIKRNNETLSRPHIWFFVASATKNIPDVAPGKFLWTVMSVIQSSSTKTVFRQPWIFIRHQTLDKLYSSLAQCANPRICKKPPTWKIKSFFWFC